MVATSLSRTRSREIDMTETLRQEYFVYPSALFVATTPYVIKTVLGSCIAVCLFDPQHALGGMNHYMLPWWNSQGLASPKYGDIAIDVLVERMLSAGADRSTLVAKIFGGAEQFGKDSSYSVGRNNIEVAEQQLRRHGIPIVSASTGGPHGRKIIYHSDTGVVKMKYLNQQVLQ